MTLRRAIVQGWDSGTSQPKGVSTAVDVRQSVSPLAARAGVFRTASNACDATGTGTMDVELQPFTVAIESTLGGFYIVVEDDVAAVELDPADSTNDRIDVIYVIQNDYQVDAGEVDSTVEYGVATGTPGVTPTAPTVPTGAFALWECEVPANATDTLDGVVFTPVFVWTAPVGSTMPVRDSTDLASWTPADGSMAYRLDASVEYRRVAGSWKAVASEPVSYSPTGFTSQVTVGTGGSSAFRYWFSDGFMELDYKIVWGTGAGVAAGGIIFPIPSGFTFDSFYPAFELLGAGGANSDGAGTAVSTTTVRRLGASTTQLVVLAQKTDGTYARDADTSLTVPVSFDAGGFFSGHARFRVA